MNSPPSEQLDPITGGDRQDSSFAFVCFNPEIENDARPSTMERIKLLG
jgi:hypothetical protein